MLLRVAGTLGRLWPEEPHRRSASERHQARSEARRRARRSLGGTALLLAPAPPREDGLRPARARLRGQLRPARRRLRLERDQRRPAELLRQQQRQLGRLADPATSRRRSQRSPQDVNLYLDLAGLYQSDNQEAKALATLRKARQVGAEEPRRAQPDREHLRRARPAARATTTAPSSPSTARTSSNAAGARHELAARPGADLGPVHAGACRPQLNDAYTKVTTAYAEGRGRLQAGRPGGEGHLRRAERAAAVGLAPPRARTTSRPRSPPTSSSSRSRPTTRTPPAVRQTLAQLQASLGQPQG